MSESPSSYPPPAQPDADHSKTEAAKTAAVEVSGSAAEAASTVAHTATEQAKDVAAQATEQARDLLGEGRSQLHDQARRTQASAASSLGALAGELRQMTEGSQTSGTATELVRQASDRAQGLASWLRDRDPGDALEEVRAFARRRPGAFILGAALAGMAAGRLTRGAVAAAQDESGTGESDGPTSPTDDPSDAPYLPDPLTGYVNAPVDDRVDAPADAPVAVPVGSADLLGDEWAAPGRAPAAGGGL